MGRSENSGFRIDRSLSNLFSQVKVLLISVLFDVIAGVFCSLPVLLSVSLASPQQFANAPPLRPACLVFCFAVYLLTRRQCRRVHPDILDNIDGPRVLG